MRLFLKHTYTHTHTHTHTHTQSGELTNRLTADTNKISNVVSLNINIMARQTIQLMGGLFYLHTLHPSMCVCAGVGLLLIFMITGIHGKFNRYMVSVSVCVSVCLCVYRVEEEAHVPLIGRWKEMHRYSHTHTHTHAHTHTHTHTQGAAIQDALASSNAAAGTSLSLIRIIRTHTGESVELKKYDKELEKTVNLMEAHDCGYGVYRLAIRVAQTALLGATLVVGYSLTQVCVCVCVCVCVSVCLCVWVFDCCFDFFCVGVTHQYIIHTHTHIHFNRKEP